MSLKSSVLLPPGLTTKMQEAVAPVIIAFKTTAGTPSSSVLCFSPHGSRHHYGLEGSAQVHINKSEFSRALALSVYALCIYKKYIM